MRKVRNERRRPSFLFAFANPIPRYRLCPIFQLSSVTGENLDLLKMFLNLLSTRIIFNNDDPAEFQIDDIYTVPVTTL
jgi:GTPase